MGKKKKQQRKIASKVDAWIAEGDLTEHELVLAGLGLMSKAVEQSKKKAFKKALKSGQRLLEIGLPSLESDNGTTNDDAVVSYAPRGGGWFGVAIDGVVVDSVQGEEAAAARAAEIFAAYAALSSDEQERRDRRIEHAGGGWYDIVCQGVPVERIRGRERAESRFEEILAMA